MILLMGNSRFYGGVVIVEVGDGSRLFFEDGCAHFIGEVAEVGYSFAFGGVLLGGYVFVGVADIDCGDL